MKLYRRIALIFICVTSAILITVVYASLVQAVIRITPVEQGITSSFIVDVSARPVEDGEIRGLVLSKTVEIADSFSLSADAENATPVEGKSSGIVTITNGKSVSQQLVERTRFLSDGGVLFRLDSGVTVPAGGTVDARITADEAGVGGDIPAGHFTIPGLSEAVQKIVYGDSKEAMTGGLKYVNALTQSDVDMAVETLRADASSNTMEELKNEAGSFTGTAVLTEVANQNIDTDVGTETDSFNASLSVLVVGVFFDEDELYQLAESALYQNIEQGLRPVGFDKSALKVMVDLYDLENGTATLKVELSGAAIPSAAHHALSRGVFAGMTSQEVARYFEENNLAKTVEVDIRPSWRDRLPRSPNKIKLIINE
jgi:hypothetical protein